jgi:hypothetical protein
MKTNDLLRSITNATKHISTTEEKRLFRDLQAIDGRLRTDDYKRFSGTRNLFDIPDRTKEIFTELQFYAAIGRSWEQIVRTIGITKSSSVADICPGFIPKVELGLFYAGFTGDVTIIDQDAKSIKQLQQFLMLFQPKFSVTPHITNVFLRKQQPFDLVLANHVIDDLIMFHFSRKEGIPLTKIYDTEEEYVALWRYILSDKRSHCSEIVKILLTTFSAYVLPNGYLCLTYYKSYMERMLRMKETYLFHKRVFTQLISEMSQNGFLIRSDLLDDAFKIQEGYLKKNECIILQKQR